MVKESPSLHKFVLDSIDISDYVLKSQIVKIRNQPVKNMTIYIIRKINDVLVIDDTIIGTEITVQRGFDSATERYIFRGEIISWKVEGSLYEIKCADKLYVANRRDYDYTWDINTDTEAGVGSEFVKTMLSYISLPYDSTSIVSTGTTDTYTLITYPAKGSILSSLKDLAKTYNYQVFYQDSNDLVYFIPDGYIETETILTTGIDIRNRIQWNNSSEDMANNITLVGGEQLDWNTETFAGPVTQVTLTATPVDTDVYVNTSTKVQRGVNSSDPKDFYVDGKKLIFTVSSSNIVVNYSYNVPTKTVATDYDSIDLYNQRDNTIINDKLTNTDDTELTATQYLQKDANPITSAPLYVIGNNDLELGQKIQVVDDINNLTKIVIVTSIQYNYPYSYDTVVVGKVPIQTIDMQIKMIEDIAKLKRQLSSETEINTQLFNLPQNIEICGYNKIESAAPDTGVLYWDSEVQGTWDDYDWGDDNEESYSVQSLIPINKTIYENFTSTEFKDAGTTATWSTAGYATFTNGQVALSTYYVKDTDLTITSVILTANYTGTLIFEVSADGVNWETVTSGVSYNLTNTGSYLYWRATSSGASTLTDITIAYI